MYFADVGARSGASPGNSITTGINKDYGGTDVTRTTS